MKLKQSFTLLLSLIAMSFTVQAQSSEKAGATGNMTVATTDKQTVDMNYSISSNATENVTLVMNLPEGAKSVSMKARILDASGKEVLSMPATALNGHFETVLKTAGLNPGVYVMELAGTGANDVVQRINITKGPGGLLIESKN